MDITSLNEFWEMLNHSPREIFDRYPLFLLGLLIVIALLIAFLITEEKIPWGEYIALIGLIIMVIGIMNPRQLG